MFSYQNIRLVQLDQCSTDLRLVINECITSNDLMLPHWPGCPKDLLMGNITGQHSPAPQVHQANQLQDVKGGQTGWKERSHPTRTDKDLFPILKEFCLCTYSFRQVIIVGLQSEAGGQWSIEDLCKEHHGNRTSLLQIQIGKLIYNNNDIHREIVF